MIEEIVFTSAKRGLETGKTGFCTVAATPNMSANLLRFLEASSGYRHLNAPGHADNPVVRSHVKVVLGGQQQHVISRVSDAGMDYSQRSNKIAHHIAFNDTASFDSGPMGLMWNDQNFIKQWDEAPRFLSPRMLTAEPGFPAACSTWEAVAGDAGRVGDLLEAFLNKRTIYLVLEPTDPAIELIDEAINILPPDQRWDFTFSTFFTRTPPNVECQVRVVFPDSAELTTAKRSSKNVIIDTRDKQRSTSQLAAFAREGRLIETGVTDQQVSIATNEQSASSGKKVVAAPREQSSVTPPSDSTPPTLASNSDNVSEMADSGPNSQYGKWLLVAGVALLLLATVAAGVWAPTIGSQNTAENDTPVAADHKNDAQKSEGQPNEDQEGDGLNSVPKEADSASGVSVDMVNENKSEQSDETARTSDTVLGEDPSDAVPREDADQVEGPASVDQEMASGADGEGEREEMGNAPASQPALKLDAKKFKRFVLTKEWERVRAPVRVFDSSHSIEEFQKCKISLVTLGDDPREIENVEVKELENDEANIKEWKFITSDIVGEPVDFLELAVKKLDEERVVGTLTASSEFENMVGAGAGGLPEFSEVALELGGVRIPLNKVTEPKPKTIPPKHNGKERILFADLPFDKDVRIKIYDGPCHVIKRNDSSSTEFEIDFTELKDDLLRELLVEQIPRIEFKILVSRDGDVELNSVPSECDKTFERVKLQRAKAIAEAVRVALEDKRKNIIDSYPPNGENEVQMYEEIKPINNVLSTFADGKSEPQKQLAGYFSKISIPVEVYDKNGQTLAVTVLYFKEGKKKSGEKEAVEKLGVPEEPGTPEKLGTLMLDVHEAVSDREDD